MHRAGCRCSGAGAAWQRAVLWRAQRQPVHPRSHPAAVACLTTHVKVGLHVLRSAPCCQLGPFGLPLCSQLHPRPPAHVLRRVLCRGAGQPVWRQEFCRGSGRRAQPHPAQHRWARTQGWATCRPLRGPCPGMGGRKAGAACAPSCVPVACLAALHSIQALDHSHVPPPTFPTTQQA